MGRKKDDYIFSELIKRHPCFSSDFSYDSKILIGRKGYNGSLTSREAGSIGGQIVKKMCPERTLRYIRTDRTAEGHEISVRYIGKITG